MLTNQKTAALRLFKHLQGSWQLKRRLGDQGYMQGIACFQPWGKGVLYYQEQGRATLGNSKAFPTHRTYAYVYDQGTIAVHFGDQKHKQPAGLLHTLQFHASEPVGQALVATGTHWCADDIYRACYLFVNPQQFQLTYQVQGPYKDYSIQAHFSKAMDTGAAR